MVLTCLSSTSFILPPPHRPSADTDVARLGGPTSRSDFLRFRSRSGGSELQSAVVTYRKESLQVDLVSMVHFAEKEYFETLQNKLQLYDCVLYDLENGKNSETRLPSFVQKRLAGILGLDVQSDCMNYQSENWFHADLYYETISKMLQDEKNQSVYTFVEDVDIRSTKTLMKPASTSNNHSPWRSKLLSMSHFIPIPLVGLLIIGSLRSPSENKANKKPELEALFNLDLVPALKIFLAKMIHSKYVQRTTEDTEEKSVMIHERNKIAAEAINSAIQNGHERIAVLSRGAHMPDLERRLCKEFNMVPSEVEWITAWTIKNRVVDSLSIPFVKKLAEVSGWPLNRYQTLALLMFSSVLAVDFWFWELFFESVVDWVSSGQLQELVCSQKGFPVCDEIQI